MAAYDREGVLCVGVVGSRRMQIAVVSRMSPCQVREEAAFNMREYVKSRYLSYSKDSMKHFGWLLLPAPANRQRRSPPW